MPQERLLTPEQVAQEFHVDVTWLASLRKRGNGPTYLKPTHKTILYRASDIEAWIASWDEKPAKKAEVVG
jgi:hypothetical protein